MKKTLTIILCAFVINSGYTHDRQGSPTVNDAMFMARQANSNAKDAKDAANRVLAITGAAILIGAIVGARIYASQHNPGQIRLATF